jgi:hypothetical protein
MRRDRARGEAPGAPVILSMTAPPETMVDLIIPSHDRATRLIIEKWGDGAPVPDADALILRDGDGVTLRIRAFRDGELLPIGVPSGGRPSRSCADDGVSAGDRPSRPRDWPA